MRSAPWLRPDAASAVDEGQRVAEPAATQPVELGGGAIVGGDPRRRTRQLATRWELPVPIRAIVMLLIAVPRRRGTDCPSSGSINCVQESECWVLRGIFTPYVSLRLVCYGPAQSSTSWSAKARPQPCLPPSWRWLCHVTLLWRCLTRPCRCYGGGAGPILGGADGGCGHCCPPACDDQSAWPVAIDQPASGT